MSWIATCDQCGVLSTDEEAPHEGQWRRVLLLVTQMGEHKPGKTKHFCHRSEASKWLRERADEVDGGMAIGGVL